MYKMVIKSLEIFQFSYDHPFLSDARVIEEKAWHWATVTWRSTSTTLTEVENILKSKNWWNTKITTRRKGRLCTFFSSLPLKVVLPCQLFVVTVAMRHILKIKLIKLVTPRTKFGFAWDVVKWVFWVKTLNYHRLFCFSFIKLN